MLQKENTSPAWMQTISHCRSACRCSMILWSSTKSMRGVAAIRDYLMKTVSGENAKCRNFRPIKTICRFLPSYIRRSCTAENYLKKTKVIMFPRKHCAVKIMRYSCVCISLVIRGTTFSNTCLRTGRTSSLFRNADFTSGSTRQNSATGILKPCICCFHWAGSM